MVPEPVEVSVFPMSVAGPDTRLKVPPVGVAVNVRVCPLQMGSPLLVKTGAGV